MRLLFALLAGAVFGLGLMLSGMTDTNKVQGFLDIGGAWDPTLAFVMGGAILPMIVAWQVATRRAKSLLGTTIPAPSEPIINRNLLVGSALFGIGWALVGLCPGPVLASLSYGGTNGILFLVAMSVGMIVNRALLTAKAAL